MPRPEPQPTRLNAVIEDAVKLHRGQLAQASVAVRLELAPDVGELPLDPKQFSRVLQNLFLNAIDAMPGGGTLTVRTAREGQVARVEVSDTGQGLTSEECDRLFTPYYTTKQHGTGLGLAIVQSVVSDHHGTIRVASEPGRRVPALGPRAHHLRQRAGGPRAGAQTALRPDLLRRGDARRALVSNDFGPATRYNKKFIRATT